MARQPSDIFGDVVVCPLEADTPGHMRHVCVTGAEKQATRRMER